MSENSPSNNLNTALTFSLATITAELAARARKKADIAWKNAVNTAKSEKDGLNILRRIMRSGGEYLIKGYSDDTLKKAKKIKEEQEEEIEDNTIASPIQTESEENRDDDQVGGRKKRIIRTKRHNKKRTNKKRTNKKRTNKKRTNKKRTNKKRTDKKRTDKKRKSVRK
jgi:hypothetical protein